MTAQLVERAIEAAKLRHQEVPASVRKARGIVHTPAEVARYGVGRIDALLRERLGCPAGLADSKVCALDPALGTGVWLAAWLDRLGATDRPGPELLAYDVDAASIGAARALLMPRARASGAQLTLYDANTLTVADPWGPTRRERVRVILGNPPWGARSESRGLTLSDTWLREFHGDAQGRSLGERRSGVLSDDYVRFFRWALEQARQAEHGALVCLATNSSFLDGPVHRGMREALLRAFDSIEVLDLGGNALRGNQGARDENLFGVRVGTCLTIALRSPQAGERKAVLAYSKVTGSTHSKLAMLDDSRPGDTQVFDAHGPQFRFLAERPPKAILEGFSLPEAFPFHREGVQTNRDALLTDADEAVLRARMQALVDGGLPFPERLLEQKATLLTALQEALSADTPRLLARLSYRPLDERFFCQLAPLCHRPRPDLSQAVAHSSLSLLSARKDRGDGPWNLFGVADALADACYLSTRSSCRTRVFPSHDPSGAPNLSHTLARRVEDRIGQPLPVQALVAYCIGVLCAESFRRDHAQALHQDYPCLPLPASAEAFYSLQGAGQAWIDAWLRPTQAQDDDALAGPTRYELERDTVWLGDRSLAVTPTMWAFRVGDFAVLPRLTMQASNVPFWYMEAAFSRVRVCVAAAASAEAAYRESFAVR